MKDHLSHKTTFFGPMGWSLITGFKYEKNILKYENILDISLTLTNKCSFFLIMTQSVTSGKEDVWIDWFKPGCVA